jgi:aminoglycoside 6'-N-acetyltransferase
MAHVSLRSATVADVPLLEYWDAQPHVIAATGDDDIADWRDELEPTRPWAAHLIAEEAGRPVGIVQIIDPALEETHYWGDCGPGLRAIDIWIGEAADLGRGIGTQMMGLALDRCFDEPDVTAVIIDPLAANVRARRFYERLGFVEVGPRRFGTDDCVVYRIERVGWAATAAQPAPIVVEHPSAQAFLAATRDIRSAEPVLTNVIGSVAEGVLAGREYASERWLTVHDAEGRIDGIAMRTAPWHLTVSPMSARAAQALGRHLAEVDPDLPGVNGPRVVVEGVLDGLASPRPARVAMVDVVRVLGTYSPPPRVPGWSRTAQGTDLDLLLDWHIRFGAEVGLPMHDVEGSVRVRVADGSLHLWCTDAGPVAMAGHAPPVPTPDGTVVRIGPVYTPEPLRGHGFGSAATAAVVEALMPGGAVLMLFADAANPGSNRIYERLGFLAVGELVETTLGASDG